MEKPSDVFFVEKHTCNCTNTNLCPKCTYIWKDYFYLQFAFVGLDRRRFFVPLQAFVLFSMLICILRLPFFPLERLNSFLNLTMEISIKLVICLIISLCSKKTKNCVLSSGYGNFTLSKQREKENSEFENRSKQAGFILFGEKKMQLHFASHGCIDGCMCLVGKLWEMCW